MLEAMNVVKNIKCLCGSWLPDNIACTLQNKIESMYMEGYMLESFKQASSKVGKSDFE